MSHIFIIYSLIFVIDDGDKLFSDARPIGIISSIKSRGKKLNIFS